MTQIIGKRMSAEIEGDFVVFLIGARINKWWQIRDVLWLTKSMPAMLKELSELPEEETGFLGFQSIGFTTLIQYWRSFDHLEAYARAPDKTHFPAWIEFNRRFKDRRADIGIWHETYLVNAGQYEAIYSGMPVFGLGKAGSLFEATGSRETAKKRLTEGSA